MTRRGVLRTLFAVRAMPIAPAAAKDSWPARKSEAGGVLAQQTSAQIAVTQTDLTLLSDRAGDGESFQTFADGSSALGSIGQAALDGDSGAQVYAQTALSKQMG